MDLPSGLTEPLHLLPPAPWGRWLVAGLVVAAALWILWRRFRPRPAAAAAPAAPTSPPPPPAGSAFAAEVDEVVRRSLAANAYRLGCHRLAGLLRRRLATADRKAETLTVGEMRRTWGRTAATAVFDRLARHQFGRRGPTRRDLRDLGEQVSAAGESPGAAVHRSSAGDRRRGGRG